MRHSILLKLFLLTLFGLIYQSVNSSLNGIYNGGTSCGNCHGNITANTSVKLQGLPAIYETNKTYVLTFLVTNPTNLKSGFNVLCTKGTFIAGTGSIVNAGKTQITHSSPMAAVGTTSTFTFSWKAPTTTSAITFKGVGNAVNGNNRDDSGDQWDTTIATIDGMFASGIENSTTEQLKLYPNPGNDHVILEGLTNPNTKIELMDLKGQTILPNFEFTGKDCIINCSTLNTGIYLIKVNDGKRLMTAKFIKA